MTMFHCTDIKAIFRCDSHSPMVLFNSWGGGDFFSIWKYLFDFFNNFSFVKITLDIVQGNNPINKEKCSTWFSNKYPRDNSCMMKEENITNQRIRKTEHAQINGAE